jgi:SAM-dependent methyltransferase
MERFKTPYEKHMEPTPQSEYYKYANGFDIVIDNLRGKRIADVGCGEDALFATYAAENGVDEMYAVDTHFSEKANNVQRLDGHLIESKAEDLPINGLDLILSHGTFGTDVGMDERKALQSLFNALEPGGQIRIFPISRSETLKGINASRTAFELALQGLDPDESVIQHQPVETKETKDGQSWVNELFIITKRAKQN